MCHKVKNQQGPQTFIIFYLCYYYMLICGLQHFFILTDEY